MRLRCRWKCLLIFPIFAFFILLLLYKGDNVHTAPKPPQLSLNPSLIDHSYVEQQAMNKSHTLENNEDQSEFRCYAISRGYQFFLIQPFEDPLSLQECSHIETVRFRKMCVVAAYLSKVDWLYVLDGDTAVINARHCLEDFIDPEAELLFYERFFSSEVMSGNFIVKSTEPVRRFMRQWAKIESEQPPPQHFFSADNGAIHVQILRVLYPGNEALVQTCCRLTRMSEWPNWELGYGAFLVCAKQAMLNWNREKMGNRSAEVRLRIQPRAQSFARDMFHTGYKHYPGDFMAHNVKDGVPFNEDMNQRLSQETIPSECRDPNWMPILDPTKSKPVTEEYLRAKINKLAIYNLKQKLTTLFAHPNLHACWPACPDVLRTFESKALD